MLATPPHKKYWERDREAKGEKEWEWERGEWECNGNSSFLKNIRKSIWKQRKTNLHGIAQSHTHASIHIDKQTPSYEKFSTQPT